MPYPCHFLKIHLNIILSIPASYKWSLSFRFLHQNPLCTSPLLHTCYMPLPSHSSWFDHPNDIWYGVQIIKILSMYLSLQPLLPHPSKAHIFSSTPYCQTPSTCIPPSMWATMFPTHTKQHAKCCVSKSLYFWIAKILHRMIGSIPGLCLISFWIEFWFINPFFTGSQVHRTFYKSGGRLVTYH